MAKQKLGRGLSELLSEVEVAYDSGSSSTSDNIIKIDLAIIKSNPHQPRKVFNEERQ